MPITRITSLTRERARQLRGTMTPPEHRLWKHLRELKQLGFHFRRQAPVGPYIADFADLTRKLIVELDGESHGDSQAVMHDAERDRFLAQHGFRILRIPNCEVSRNCSAVVEFILSKVEHRVHPTPAPSPQGGGENNCQTNG